MKFFSYLIIAVAGTGLASCTSEDVPTISDASETKSVSLKIEGVGNGIATRSVDSPTATTTMRLKDLKIVFYNGASGAVYRTEQMADTDTQWAALTTGNGVVYHNLDPMVDAILIVGNHQNKGITWTNANTIKASELDAAGENTEASTGDTKEYVTLFGEDLTLVEAADQTVDPDAQTLYQAEVTLAPRVARFEIGNIRCENLTSSLYRSFNLKGIGLVDFSRKVVLGSGAPVAPKLTINDYILEPGKPAQEGKFVFGAASEIAWAYDTVDPMVAFTSSDYIYNPGAQNDQRFAYNFIPDGFPNIKLVLDNVTPLDPNVTVNFNYVATASFTGHNAPEAGHIYRVDMVFKEINIGPWDPNSTICVNVEVSVLPWVIETLTPVFR